MWPLSPSLIASQGLGGSTLDIAAQGLLGVRNSNARRRIYDTGIFGEDQRMVMEMLITAFDLGVFND